MSTMTIALSDAQGATSWAELEVLASVLAMRFSDEAAGRTLPVAFEAVATRSTCAFALAALLARVPLVPLHPNWSARERHVRLAQVPVRIDVGETEVESLVREGISMGTGAGESAPRTTALSSSPAVILFTSGTTGAPKAVSLTMAGLAASAHATARRFPIPQDSASLMTLSAATVGGFSVLSRALVARRRVIVLPRWEPNAVALALARENIATVSVVPSMLAALLDDRHAVATIAGARHFLAFVVGGAPMPRSLEERARVARIALRKTYGLTEGSSQVTLQTDEDSQRDDGNVGKPLEGVLVRILDEEDRDVPQGAVGRIAIGGSTLASGYVGDRGFEGHFTTRDLGLFDSGGALHVAGRADDVLITGGHKVNPTTVEEAVREVPAVRDVVAFGVEDARWGTIVAIVVRLDGNRGTDAEAVAIAAIRERTHRLLSSPSRPRRIAFSDALPPGCGSFDKPRRRAIAAQFSSPSSPSLQPQLSALTDLLP